METGHDNYFDAIMISHVFLCDSVVFYPTSQKKVNVFQVYVM